ncbi:MAG: RNA methyltransferase [Halobacteriovoraceae bacterium]|jgi:tRNA G18 (ribose-2'-O)-methylase SpoU|nr:RNA methyltransferase [Halobacteriovoraceae bacterium]MBT5093829.1 RNA methyltransferase [Halobacteriovoraceae bacterium]
MKPITISDIANPNIKEFLTLKDKQAKAEEYIICESEKVFKKLLNSPYKILKVLSDSVFFEKYTSELQQVECFLASSKLLQEITGYNAHHGVLVKAERPQLVPLKELGEKILVLNGITSPENCGAIVRNCAGFNITSLIIDDKSVSPYLKRCIRVSTGNIFALKVHHTYNLKKTLKNLQESGHQVVSTANRQDAIPLKNFEAPDKIALIIGSEGHGIESEVLEISDRILKIEVNPEVEHLNAACSSAIFLYTLS